MTQEYYEDLSAEDIPSQTADTLLESLSLPTMETSILEQIEGDLNTNRNFLETVLEKFRMINDNTEGDVRRGIQSEMADWAYKLILAIVRQYNLAYDGSEDEDSLNALDTLDVLYQFFVLNKHSNTLKFFNNYIDNNKKYIVESMGILGRGTDVTTIANRKKGYPKYDVAILSNIEEVIQFISNANVSATEFLNTIDDGEYVIAAIHDRFDSSILIGEFVSDYISSEIGTYADDISIELRTSIRGHLARL